MTVAALEQALTFLSRTDLIATARQQPLPDGVTDILKITSGDNEALLVAQENFRYSQEDVRHAAEFYVQQVLFAPLSDHYRVLGADPGDAEAKIKLHYRLLVRWLHPDKNAGDWEAVFSERINRAWQALRTPECRLAYDEQLSSAQLGQSGIVPSREVRPTRWRDNKAEARFISARTIKRLPIAVFSSLGIAALLILLWFSQMQPELQPSAKMAVESKVSSVSAQQAKLSLRKSSIPATLIVEIPTGKQAIGSVEPISKTVTTVENKKHEPTIIPEPVLVADNAKKAAPSLAVSVVVPPIVITPQKQKTTIKLAPLINPVITAIDDKSSKKGLHKDKQLSTSSEASQMIETAMLASGSAVATEAHGGQADIASDASVKQFLQRFSRVYAEGDYFALHNLFTKDLSILGAVPQRTVLHSYRQLFENSQSREISLDHVTLLTSEENIVVIASYQVQVMPLGKAEVQLSRGDIRLDLRVENGQLRIIRLQSDVKSG